MVKPSSSNTPASSPTENGLDNNNANGGVPTTMQVESSEMMDWTSFLSMLDTNQEMSTSGYGFYPGLYPPPPPPDDVDDDDDQNGGDAFSQSSFLWNF
ncbi:hypothetical protein CCACVL1_20824 [Corchorus capsularis]|uniref:Uncharacterized protein n=1 Tax=Corchorus capsularis TaxID=210143 RepID=A0A1R3H9L3_COCAP|nr:hypothetical protein CCACVL1_20824 [Corchorus capsularis]